jgi:hypothetical protein
MALSSIAALLLFVARYKSLQDEEIMGPRCVNEDKGDV